MLDELSQLDELNESDMMDAFGSDSSNIIIEDVIENKEIKKEVINNIDTNDLASLLSQLLNNKTIEITIKIKD